MGSFKLDKGVSAKEQAKSAGALLIILGIVVGIIWYLPLGAILVIVGIIVLLGGQFASS